jgi:hypothetical protein
MTQSIAAALRLLLLSLLPMTASATPGTSAGEELQWDLTNRTALAILLPGMSHHFQPPQATNRKWNETHAGLGLETRSKWDETGWYFKAAGGVMRDSVESWGLYGGAVWQKRVFESPSWTIDAGGGLFIFYRALHFDGERMWLPGTLPVLSLDYKPTGTGLNILYVPNFKTNAGEMPAVLFAQLTQGF